MNQNIILLIILFIGNVQLTFATKDNDLSFIKTQVDSTRIAELDQYWERLNRSVIEGDFETYKNCFHEDAVIVFASSSNKTSVPISTALSYWKEGFKNTKEGKIKVNVEFRFSQRIGNETTAHETGIFIYSSTDNNTKVTDTFIIPFEMLLVKRENNWYGMMEHQKPFATQEEWDDLK